MDAVIKRPAWPLPGKGLRPFANWLLCWIVLPNLFFGLLWLVGGPQRSFQILLTAGIGLALHRAPFALKYAAFAGALLYSTAAFISALFNLHIKSFLASILFAMEMKPASSPQYVVCGVALAFTLTVAFHCLRRSTVLDRPLLLINGMAAALALAGVDIAVAHGSIGSYNRTAEADAPFSSATASSGLLRSATGDRHVVLVMVEAMGQPVDPALRRRLVDMWATPAVRARYEVTTGETLYYGSTTSGEIRELCGRWGDYEELRTRRDENCLPAQLARKGYNSQAWHSFTDQFFDRREWYPHVGFRQMRFGDRIMQAGAAQCPGVFPGACDWEVPAQIASTLKSARQPQFLYWLTVTAHLPVLKDEQLGTAACEQFDAKLNEDFPQICRLLQVYDRTGAALAKQVTASDFPAADILIVGDHIPPFVDRHHREQFAADRVPWIMLRAKTSPKPGFAALPTDRGRR